MRLAEEEYHFWFLMHHIVSDGWSIKLLGHELASLYNAYRSGEDSPLSALPS